MIERIKAAMGEADVFAWDRDLSGYQPTSVLRDDDRSVLLRCASRRGARARYRSRPDSRIGDDNGP